MNFEQILVWARRFHRRGVSPVAAFRAATQIASTREAVAPHRLHYVQTRCGVRLVPVNGDGWREAEVERYVSFQRAVSRGAVKVGGSFGYASSSAYKILIRFASGREFPEAGRSDDEMSQQEAEYWLPVPFPRLDSWRPYKPIAEDRW